MSERQRLIRYENLRDDTRPELLSIFDADKNLVRIDRLRSATLPKYSADALMFTLLPFTRLTASGLHFEAYDAR